MCERQKGKEKERKPKSERKRKEEKEAPVYEIDTQRFADITKERHIRPYMGLAFRSELCSYTHKIDQVKSYSLTLSRIS